jgi:hypothetical protein
MSNAYFFLLSIMKKILVSFIVEMRLVQSFVGERQ